MVVADVVPDVVRVEGVHGLAEQVGREADLDAHLLRVHDPLRGVVEEGRVPEPVGLEREQLECLGRGAFGYLGGDGVSEGWIESG